jgi:hypothetical protein
MDRLKNLIGFVFAPVPWQRFVALFAALLGGALLAVYAFIVLIDPYDIVPFSLPLDRHIVSLNQRYIYPQVVRSHRFDSLIIGTSTSRLLDPDLLGPPTQARFANLAMDSAMAWEQQMMANYFLRKVGQPKIVIVGLDYVWCDPQADQHRITPRGFPEWLYDDNPFNDYLYLLNANTVEIAWHQLGYQLGLYDERIRFDGFGVFVPPESRYDPARAEQAIWHGSTQRPVDAPPPVLSDAERGALSFPALAWLDRLLADMPATVKVLAYMPVHVAAQPWPGSREAALEAECKRRIASIARLRGAKVIDWRMSSPLTRDDANYWDNLHYRLPIAHHLADDLVALVLGRLKSSDPNYNIVVE